LVKGYKIKILPIVKLDLRKAKKWYQEKSANLAHEFKIEVNKEIDYIRTYPEHYQIKYKELSQSLAPRFPYAIFYSVELEHKQIIIFGVLHTSRNPLMIRERMRK